MKANRVKYRITCTAPTYLTEFNKDVNADIKSKCFQKDLFQPHISCEKCEYVEIKRY